MPKINQTKKGGIILWDEQDWLAGLHPQNASSTLLSQRNFGNTLASVKNFDPYRELGYAAPGFSPTDVTTVSQVDTKMRKMVVDDDNSSGQVAYGITAGDGAATDARVLKLGTLSADPPVMSAAGNFPHTIAVSGVHAGDDNLVGWDIVSYTTNVTSTATKGIFYSWGDDVDWDVGFYNIGTDGFDDDFMSGVPTSALAGVDLTDGQGVEHPMIVGDDDILYMGSGRQLHGFDGATGADGTFQSQVLTLPTDYVIQSFAKIENFLVIFAYKKGAGTSSFFLREAKAFFWDYLSLDPTRIIDLNDNFVSESFSYKGTVGCFTQGRRTDPGQGKPSKLLIYDGNTFVPVVSFKENAPIRGGVVVEGDRIMWLTSDGSSSFVYSWGSPFAGFPTGLNKLTSGSGSSNGALATITGTLQVASTGTTTSGGLQEISNTSRFNSSAIVATSLAEPDLAFNQRARAKRVTIRYEGVSSGGRDLDLALVDRFGTSTTIITNKATVAASNKHETFTYDVNGASLPFFDSLKCVLEWGSGSAATAAPMVKSVEVEYEIVEI